MAYSIFFDYGDATYRLPVNPEKVEVSSTMSVEKYEVLKTGQVAVPTHMELNKYSFECELPSLKVNLLTGVGVGISIAWGLSNQINTGVPSYAEFTNDFKEADYYIDLFTTWRNKLVPVRFIASNGITEDIDTPVLIEELTITEKAGEEGDKYVSFVLLEYKDFGKVLAQKVNTTTGKLVKTTSPTAKPKTSGYYVVQAGDSLWSIAKKYYGDGSKCNVIYNANKDKIKNPNLIKVGQKLKIPSTDEFSKYSTALPVTKTSASTKNKSTTLATKKAVVTERPIAGITLLLDSISGTTGGGGKTSGGGAGRSTNNGGAGRAT